MKPTHYRPFAVFWTAAWIVSMTGVLLAPYVVALANPGDFLIRNTIRISLLYWAIAAAIMLINGQFARWFWSLAWAAYVIHVAMAFEHYHRWSHASAVHHVEETSGFGSGIFVSYLFTLLWTLDVLWWWLAPTNHESRPPWQGWVWHGFMVFIIVNGTIVYETGPIRYVATVALIGLSIVWIQTTYRPVKPRRGGFP